MNSEFFSAYSSLKPAHLRLKLKITNIINHLARLLYLLPILIFQTQTAFATNYYFEDQISRALKKEIDPSELIWLETGIPRKTLALHKLTQGIDKVGSIIILADLNNHPDWPLIIQPLRNALPRFGWETLSIQMPTKTNDLSKPATNKLYEIVEARIKSALNYLRNQGGKNIVIIGHRNSANIAIKFLADNQNDKSDISALVGISSFDSSWIKSSDLIREMPIAFLDVFAQNDSPEVLEAAPKRLASAKFAGQLINKPAASSLSNKVQQLAKNKTGNVHYRQAKINGADEYFSTHQDTLLKTIRGWLKSYEIKQ